MSRRPSTGEGCGTYRDEDTDAALALIAVGGRHGEHVVTADGGLAPYGSTAPERINDNTPRFRITRSGPTPTLEGPVESSWPAV